MKLSHITRLSDRYKIYIVTFVYIIINAVLVYKGKPYFNYLPFVMAAVFVAFLRLDTYLLVIVFLTPLSIPLREFHSGLDFDMWLPTEPLLVGLLLILILKTISGEKLDKRILVHPVSFLIYLNLFWIFITAFTSTMVLVSVKFLLSRIWFVVAYYFFAAQVFKNQDNIKKYLWCYTIPLLLVIAYAISRHTAFGLSDQQAAHSVMNPFFTDHTSYGAILAMMIPVTAGFVFNNSFKGIIRILTFFIFLVLCIAIILSYTRAAWVSLIVALAVMIILVLRIQFSILFIIGIVISIILVSKSDDIVQMIEKNRQESSSDLAEHVQSISNITSDASNLERINRWNCAVRMFREKPFFGWGPGTYMFQYAPFQTTREKTEISTNAADRGNAHSEYLGPLSESGLFGMLTFLAIVIFTCITGVRVYQKAPDRNTRILAASVFLGLVTYYVHGIMNNFLDSDKASATFWGFTAILVSMDLFLTGNNRTAEQGKSENFNAKN
ncbi:MAG: O-antigen ligase family protein [Bacteroidales bacterium]|nr:O-antigen ligase family protein [Bacteroidales bacterium]